MIRIQDIDFSELSPTDRLLLAQKLWDSVVGENAVPPTTPEQRAEIERRIDLANSGGMARYSWREVKSRVLNRK
jgi:putative addiction module component (TIGR02574 family)